MLTYKIRPTLPDSPHPVIRPISINPRFRALYLARQNEFSFFRLINTQKISFFHFGCWLLPEKFSFRPKNNGLARVWGSCSPSPSLPGSYAYARDPVNCMALSANSYKMVEAIPYTDIKFVSVPIKQSRIGN